LQGLQLRDFDYLRERVLPEQLAQLSVFQTLVEAAALVPSVQDRTDFTLLSLKADKDMYWATYAIPNRGALAIALVQISGDWYVDLANTKFINTDNKQSPLGSLKVSAMKPMDRARAFLEAFVKLDLVQAASYGTENTKSAMLALQSVVGLITRDQGPAIAEGDIKMMSEKIEGESAVVEYRIGNKPIKPLNLVRAGGNWLVDLAPGQPLP
jgi:hypothetical protein